MIQVACPADPVLRRLLADHPQVEVAGEAKVIEVTQGPWERTLTSGDQAAQQYGLLELMDNNPIVCADSLSVPSPLATLLAIALGPITQSGLLQAPPAGQTNLDAEPQELHAILASVGYKDELSLSVEESDLGRCCGVTIFAEIDCPDRPEEIDELYDEAFGRSFYVRSSQDQPWSLDLVAARPWATYDLRLTEGESGSLLTIQVIADRDGKCGAAQLVHALNIMCGFEECLGISEKLY
jgi:N-acetyl-gamma-glutamylphosphate reductase